MLGTSCCRQSLGAGRLVSALLAFDVGKQALSNRQPIDPRSPMPRRDQ